MIEACVMISVDLEKEKKLIQSIRNKIEDIFGNNSASFFVYHRNHSFCQKLFIIKCKKEYAWIVESVVKKLLPENNAIFYDEELRIGI